MEAVAKAANGFARAAAGRKVLTMIYVVDPAAQKVLLGLKARGFGAGNWNAFGGKVDPSDKDVRDGAMRELHEECGLRVASPEAMRRVGLNFYEYPAALQEKLFEVHIYFVDVAATVGEVVESEEMHPIQMVAFDDIPYDKMWADDVFWLDKALRADAARAAAGDGGAASDASCCFMGYYNFESYAKVASDMVAFGTLAELDQFAPPHIAP